MAPRLSSQDGKESLLNVISRKVVEAKDSSTTLKPPSSLQVSKSNLELSTQKNSIFKRNVLQ
jgi:hypothetical protein